MTRTRIFLSLFFLLVPSCIFAQSRTQSAANKSWPSFWTKFSSAMNKKDREALRRMMADDFDDGISVGTTPSEHIKAMDQFHEWRQDQRAIASGTKPFKSGQSRPARITRDNLLIFEFRNGRWYWTGVAGD